MVEKADPAWITLLDGAEQSLRSGNPDRVRHTLVSLRELLTQVIHRLAPDEDIRTELPEAEWYDKGRPTRKARLRLILNRRYGNDVLLDFVDKDLAAAAEVFDLFQRGTHEIVSTITPSELTFIVSRVKLLVCELIYSPAGN